MKVDQDSVVSGIASQIDGIRDTIQKVQKKNDSTEKKNKMLHGDLKNLKEEFWSSTKDLADLKADVDEKVQKAVAGSDGKQIKKKKQGETTASNIAGSCTAVNAAAAHLLHSTCHFARRRGTCEGDDGRLDESSGRR